MKFAVSPVTVAVNDAVVPAGTVAQPNVHAASRFKQRAIRDLSKPKHRLIPYFARVATAVWPLRLAWSHVLTVALLAGAVGFFFSHLHEIRPRSTQADREPTIAKNKEVAVPPQRPTAKLNIEINHQFTQARAPIWLGTMNLCIAERCMPTRKTIFCSFASHRATN